MGKAAKWFRSLLSSKKQPQSAPTKDRKNSKWNFSDSSTSAVKFSTTVGDPLSSPYVEGLDANKHAIAVAAATAAVAEAALAAAHAAAEVVRLTSSGGSGRTSADRRPVSAAIKIQSAFRAYLARRALKALKGLVKLQALVRGHIVRKQSSDMLRRMQAMARIQARASAHRSYSSECSIARPKFSIFHNTATMNLRKNEEKSNSGKYGGPLLKQSHSRSYTGNSLNKEGPQLASKWLNHQMDYYTWNNLHNGNGLGDDERSDKILEIDTWKPHQNPTRKSKGIPISHYFSAWTDKGHDPSRTGPSLSLPSKPNHTLYSEEVASVISSRFPPEGDQEAAAWTTDNSPRLNSASSRPSRGPFTPARSECSRSVFGDYIGHPSYMANTESSRAKVRSHSAPKQRVPYEELGCSTKFGLNLWESDTISEKESYQRSNTYLYSGQVKRQGTPGRDSGCSSLYGHRQ